MGGRQKKLTQARRKALGKEMMDAIVAGTFTLNNQPLESVLDGVDQGIREDRYPIEVTLDALLAIWSAPESDQTQTAAGAETTPAAETTNGHPAFSSAQQAVIMLKPDGTPVETPSQTPYTAPESTPHMQEIQAQADARNAAIAGQSPASGLEIGVPQTSEPEKPVDIDLEPVSAWLELAKKAQEKIDASKDILDQAKAQISDYLDQQGGPDKSKLGHLHGKPVYRRTFVTRKNFLKEKLFADHPELNPETYTDESSFYKVTIL